MLGAQARAAEYNAAKAASARQATRDAEEQNLPPKFAPISLSAFARNAATNRNRGIKSWKPLILDDVRDDNDDYDDDVRSSSSQLREDLTLLDATDSNVAINGATMYHRFDRERDGHNARDGAPAMVSAMHRAPTRSWSPAHTLAFVNVNPRRPLHSDLGFPDWQLKAAITHDISQAPGVCGMCHSSNCDPSLISDAQRSDAAFSS